MHDRVVERNGFLFDTPVEDLDPATVRITAFEERRQVDKLIMIASESAAPLPVRQMLASVFTDLYAEGYPAAHTTHEPEALIADIPYQIAYHERYGDRRYYKGTEMADLVEALAQERVRALFAPNRYPHNPSKLGPDDIQANVQPLSGANANTAVYLGLLQPGDTILGMNLAEGGHLSHGSPVNLSGKLYKVFSYGVDLATGHIDYDALERLAREHNPRMIVTGASAYPWAIDFPRVRQICDGLPKKAYLLADVSHPAGLVAAGLFPNPVGVADVTTFTTHKTLIGPRAAVILTTSESLARRIDRAVFPGLQGGPHMNTIAALAVSFKIGLTPEFDALQRQIVRNARTLVEELERRGIAVAYGGTDTHLFLIDLKRLAKPSGIRLNGDVAARVLDLAGVVCNKNTIAGDTSATFPSGVRFGTPWITQRGLVDDDMRVLAGIIADVLHGIVTYASFGDDESAHRGKIPADTLRRAQAATADLAHRRAVAPMDGDAARRTEAAVATLGGARLLEVSGRRARQFLDEASDGDIWGLEPGQAVGTNLRDANGTRIGRVAVLRRPGSQFGLDRFIVAIPTEPDEDVGWWLGALSNGLVLFDPADPWAKIDGPVALSTPSETPSDAESASLLQALSAPPAAPVLTKPYFIGQRALSAATPPPPRSEHVIGEAPSGLKSPIDPEVVANDASGHWTMPRTYTDPGTELTALRETVGLIDESGLGILEVSGPDAGRFLDLVTTNDVAFLAPNAAQYTFLLDPRGQVVADALLYRTEPERFLLTTCPSATASVRAWLAAALSGRCLVSPEVPARVLPARLSLRDARQGADARVVVGLAGPNAAAVLRALADSAEDRRRVARLRRFTNAVAKLAGQSVLVSRTGHTGAHAYEVFVAAASARAFWDAALAKGAPSRIQPVGWEAWHAAGVSAGLPWFRQDLGGSRRISPMEAGFGAEVRTHKPFFVGRAALLEKPYPPERRLARFIIQDGPDLLPDDGDPILDASDVCVGWVTSGPVVGADPVGLALLDQSLAVLGTPLRALVGFARKHSPELGQPISPDGEGYPVARIATIARFPK